MKAVEIQITEGGWPPMLVEGMFLPARQRLAARGLALFRRVRRRTIPEPLDPLRPARRPSASGA